MRFTLLALWACQSFALRPEKVSQAAVFSSMDDAVVGCAFTAHHDGLADGIIVSSAGTKKWNGCYERADSLDNGLEIQYRHQEHGGSIYQWKGVWRIAEYGKFTAYQAPGIKSSRVPRRGWAAGLDDRTPTGMGEAPAPTTEEVFIGCDFKAHYDGLADGIIVSGAGTKKWNGCYERADSLDNGLEIQYKHQKHGGSIYQWEGVWRIAEYGKYTAYQAPDKTSRRVPRRGWRAGLDDRTPVGMGEAPAPKTKEVFVGCDFKAHLDGVPDGVLVTRAGTKKWNGCYERADSLDNGLEIQYKHQEHGGSIYKWEGVWRIAEYGKYTAYQAPGIESSVVPRRGWRAGLDDRTPTGMGEKPPPKAMEIFAKCEFTAFNDGLADGIMVVGAGTTRWNGCYQRVDLPDNGLEIQYKHQEHGGSIYQWKGVWRIAEYGKFTAYQAPGIESSDVPPKGWATDLDDRTPAGMGEAPAPTTHEVFA